MKDLILRLLQYEFKSQVKQATLLSTYDRKVTYLFPMFLFIMSKIYFVDL